MDRLAGSAFAGLLAASACCVLPARAQAPARLQACLDAVPDNEHGSRWPGVIVCYESEADTQDRRLQSLYASLEAAPRLGPAVREQVANGRRQWMAFRDSWCAFEQDYAKAPNADIARLSCRIDLARTQADRVAEQAAALR